MLRNLTAKPNAGNDYKRALKMTLSITLKLKETKKTMFQTPHIAVCTSP